MLAHILAIFPQRGDMGGEAVQGYTPEINRADEYCCIREDSAFKDLSTSLTAVLVLYKIRRDLWTCLWIEQQR